MRVETHEYLSVLNTHEWKSARVIRRQLEKLKGGNISGAALYSTLAYLEQEGCIESREQNLRFSHIPRKEYKLTTQGASQKECVWGELTQFPQNSIP